VETALPAGALITGVSLPKSAISPSSLYRKVRERASYAFATVSIVAALELDDGIVRGARIALGGVASRPWRAFAAEAELLNGPAAAERFRAAADAELATAEPLRDNAYKVTLARNLIEAVLTNLAGI
jgi:xanthine dehydrogenase YagS FAD-binding subunit